MMQIFSTAGHTPGNGLAFWQDVVCKAYAKCDGSPVDRGTPFRATTEIGDFATAKITSVTSDPIKYRRSRRDVSEDGRDDVFIKLVTDGQVRFSQNGRRLVSRTGDILFYDTAQAYQFDNDMSYSAYLMRLRREAFVGISDDVDRFGGTVLKREDTQAALVRSLMENAMSLARAGQVSEVVATPLVQLLTASFASRVGMVAERTGSQDGKLADVKRYLLRHIDDAMLTLDVVARDNAISSRSLTRLFAIEGLTPMAWLQSARLSAARRDLEECRVHNVTEAAMRYGFGDASAFGRAFKRAYGITPKAVHRKLR